MHKRSQAPFLLRSADLRPSRGYIVFPDESAAVGLARTRRNGVLFERGEFFLTPAVHLYWLTLCRVIPTVAIENPRIRPGGQNPAIDERSTPTQGNRQEYSARRTARLSAIPTSRVRLESN